jgi:hypothetical protein
MSSERKEMMGDTTDKKASKGETLKSVEVARAIHGGY